VASVQYASDQIETGLLFDMQVILYSTRFCPYCNNAKALLSSKGIEFEDIPVDGNSELREEMTRKSGRRTVPQIWIGDKHIGGCEELFFLERSNRLDSVIDSVMDRIDEEATEIND
jgi:glutaredoxin 3